MKRSSFVEYTKTYYPTGRITQRRSLDEVYKEEVNPHQEQLEKIKRLLRKENK